jgi:hypothetical protein
LKWIRLKIKMNEKGFFRSKTGLFISKCFAASRCSKLSYLESRGY